MFTGIITSTGIITDAQSRGDLRVTIACDFAGELTIGESVAVNGCCLTVTHIIKQGQQADPALSTPWAKSSRFSRGQNMFSADISAETQSCTAPHWQKDSIVNLERSLKLGDALDGHLVTGHVDGAATITGIAPDGDSHILTIKTPGELSCFIAQKGSVTLDGISLTVNKVEGDNFWVNIIPHTWQHTTLGKRRAGDKLNIEIDLMARYAARLLSCSALSRASIDNKIDSRVKPENDKE